MKCPNKVHRVTPRDGLSYTGRTIRLDSRRGGQPSKHQLARIKVKVCNAVADCEVAVVDKLECPALLGVDLGKEFMHAMLTNFLAQTSQCMSRGRLS